MTGTISLTDLQKWIDQPPFHRRLGIRAVSFDADIGQVVLRLPFNPELQRSASTPQIHGGVTATLIDIAGDYAFWVKLGFPVPTINLRIDYLRMADATDLLATARVVKSGRSIGIADVEITGGAGELLAVGRGTYGTRPPK